MFAEEEMEEAGLEREYSQPDYQYNQNNRAYPVRAFILFYVVVDASPLV